MGQGVAHAADDDGAPKVGHLRTNAQLAPGGRKAAVGCNHQGGAQALAGLPGWGGQGKVHLGVGGQGGHAVHLRSGDDAHTRGAGRYLVGRAAQGMVGHDEAQRGAWAGGRGAWGLAKPVGHVQLHGGVRAHGAVVDFCGADVPYLAGLQAPPGAQALQRGCAGVGEGDFPPIRGGLL